MSVESNTTIEELGDKGHWLRKFRKAKNLNTLQLMVSNAIDKHHKIPAIAAAIYLASRGGDYVVGTTLTVDGGINLTR
mgnify:CR=1 FL=1